MQTLYLLQLLNKTNLMSDYIYGYMSVSLCTSVFIHTSTYVYTVYVIEIP